MLLPTSRLLRPVNYLKIKGGGLSVFNWWYPFLFSMLTLLYVYFYPINLELTGANSSIIGKTLTLLNILPGFYIAALAAVSTFNRSAMDRPLDGTPVTLYASENGETRERGLTRRRFLCYLFGYLSFLSLALFIFGTIINTASPSEFLSGELSKYKGHAALALFYIYLFFFYQMIIITLFGLFYLSDRIHWKEKEKRIE